MASLAARGAAARSGDRRVHRAPGDEQPLTVLRSAVEDMGLRVLKLHCSVGDFSPATAPRPGLGLRGRGALPVVLHAGHAPRATAAGWAGGGGARRHPGAR